MIMNSYNYTPSEGQIEYIKKSFDNMFSEVIEGCKNEFTFYINDYCFEEQLGDADAIKLFEELLEQHYLNNPDYNGWKIERDGLGINVVSKKYLEELESWKKESEKALPRLIIKFRGDQIEMLDDKVTKAKSENHKGVFNVDGDYYNEKIIKDGKIYGRFYTSERNYYDALCHIRDDFVCVNEGQYRIIYDKEINEDTCKETHKDKSEYILNIGVPFFSSDEDFFDKKAEAIKGFLAEAEKVAVSPDMMLIPFFCKGEFYYLTIDNFTEHISIDSVNTAFKHINKQSNLYYQIYDAITKELRDDYNEFEHHLLRSLRKATGINKRLVNKFYPKHPERLLTSKYFYTVE